ASRVRHGLHTADWPTRRELIRALVKRVDVEHGQVKIVFRVPPSPPGASPPTDALPDRGRGHHPAMGYRDETDPPWLRRVRRVHRFGAVVVAEDVGEDGRGGG